MHSRRAILQGLSALAVAPAVPALSLPMTAPPLTSDIGRLRRVLMLGLDPNAPFSDRLSDALLPRWETDIAAATRQHRALMDVLRAQGVEIVDIADALAEAIDATRGSGVFAAWIAAAHPRLAPLLPAVTPAMILGRDPAQNLRLDAAGDFLPGPETSTGMVFTRDSAVMTPRGLLMCRANSHRRRRENMLLRYLYAHAPSLARYPVAYDAVASGPVVEGGDCMVVDRNTLMLGTGNRTDPRAAPALARALDMDVLAVQTVERRFLRPRQTGEPWPLAELKILFLHLDTFFTQVGARHALTVPWLLEEAHAKNNPLARYIRGAVAETLMSEEDAEAALKLLEAFGRVKLYRRGTGREEELGPLKLVDWARREKWRLTFVGGAPPPGDADGFRHFMAVVHPELHRQAANVVQAVPGRVIAYDGNPMTRAALQADGVGVDALEARELWSWSGGPHCLTQPLERS